MRKDISGGLLPWLVWICSHSDALCSFQNGTKLRQMQPMCDPNKSYLLGGIWSRPFLSLNKMKLIQCFFSRYGDLPKMTLYDGLSPSTAWRASSTLSNSLIGTQNILHKISHFYTKVYILPQKKRMRPSVLLILKCTFIGMCKGKIIIFLRYLLCLPNLK